MNNFFSTFIDILTEKILWLVIKLKILNLNLKTFILAFQYFATLEFEALILTLLWCIKMFKFEWLKFEISTIQKFHCIKKWKFRSTWIENARKGVQNY